ncbi:helix-hairpin-helix domain-containing protein [Stigmatella aurantiaca]|nr:helix-hairpin-helix domain-containing protein [Stigmatella aurantiaca]EAU62136.1 DNA polymerase IV [Stigmatella aurantiaca DW4/3-1]
MTPPDKNTVVQVLRNLSLLLQLKGENAFKVRAYDTAADRLSGTPQDLATLVQEGRLQDLPGIGQGLAEKITELVTTGKLGFYEELKAEYPPGLMEMLQLPDVGPKKVIALWNELKVGSVAELELACRQGRVRELKGFGAKSEAKILEGIALHQRAQGKRKLLGDVLPTVEDLLTRLKAVPGVVRVSPAGSVRRRAETVGDVDLLASAPQAGPVLEALATSPGVAVVLGKGESKCSVRMVQEDLQVDLRVLPDEDFATALHHFTGSKAHHVRLRGLGQEKG